MGSAIKYIKMKLSKIPSGTPDNEVSSASASWVKRVFELILIPGETKPYKRPQSLRSGKHRIGSNRNFRLCSSENKRRGRFNDLRKVRHDL